MAVGALADVYEIEGGVVKRVYSKFLRKQNLEMLPIVRHQIVLVPQILLLLVSIAILLVVANCVVYPLVAKTTLVVEYEIEQGLSNYVKIVIVWTQFVPFIEIR